MSVLPTHQVDSITEGFSFLTSLPVPRRYVEQICFVVILHQLNDDLSDNETKTIRAELNYYFISWVSLRNTLSLVCQLAIVESSP